MTNEQAWSEAYQQCLTELRPLQGGGRADGAGAPEPADPSVAMARPPKSSAAERTLPLFEDEYAAKTWRDAYDRVVAELAPPLSSVLLAKIAEKRNGAATAKLVVEIPDVVEQIANDSEAIGRNAVRLAEKHEPSTSPHPNEYDGSGYEHDFVPPPKDDSESGFTQPNGELLPNWANPKIPDPVTGPPLFIGERVAPGAAMPDPRSVQKAADAERAAAAVAAAATPSPAEKEKRGKGRPAGSKNRAPKPWKAAYTRVMAELAPS